MIMVIFMKFVRKLPDVNELKKDYALSSEQNKRRKDCISEINTILANRINRKIICVGPCSADREDAVIEYVLHLAKLQEKVKDKFLIIPRVYTAKPRTKGVGYKGLVHRPELHCTEDDLWEGLIAVRKMHLHVIQETGMYCADEMLYPEMIYYILDLLAYVAIGARSVEDQSHRLTASGLELPVGMKNPTSGDLKVLLNSISAAQVPQTMIYRGWEVKTEGNCYTHAILRGYTDKSEKVHPNYHYEDLCEFYDMYQKQNLKNMSLIIDCNHCNSNKRYEQQVRIAKEVMQTCNNDRAINSFVKGLMIESYLEDGCQMFGQGIYGKSITDACLGLEKTINLIMYLYNDWNF